MNTLLNLFSKNPPPSKPPIWFMRQAGRYLPEYQATRKQAGSFLNLCYTPELACEVTLQPLQRYPFNAAILFADILLIPQALGQDLDFIEGKGPRLNKIENIDSLSMDNFQSHLSPIYQTLNLLTQKLPEDIALIGFAGSPWTVASYMIAGRGTPNQEPAHHLMQNDEVAFSEMIDLLVEATTIYLKSQIDNGATCLQLFDSWASSLHGDMLEKYCFDPNRKILANLRNAGVTAPVIFFPRGIKTAVCDFVKAVNVDAISLDQTIDLSWACDNLPEDIVTQGNLNPETLRVGGVQLEQETKRILDITRGRKHIFNLGHGILPQTPPENIDIVFNVLNKET